MTSPTPAVLAALSAPVLGVALAMSTHAQSTATSPTSAPAPAAAASKAATPQAAAPALTPAQRSAAHRAHRVAVANRAAKAKAAKLAASQKAAAKRAAAARNATKSTASRSMSASRSLAGSCVAKRSGNSGLQSWPSAVRGRIADQFGIDDIGGYRPGSGSSDHHDGLALDVMTSSGRGDAVAAWARKNADTLNVKYVIWKQRIWTNGSSGWRGMSDRGDATANHFDHVHISFDPGSGGCPRN